jgi:hypothetical protein
VAVVLARGALVAAAAALGLGCTESAPAVEAPVHGAFDAGAGGFADTVIAFTSSGQVVSCTGMLGACGDVPPPCQPARPALGPTDGKTYPLGAGDRIELALRCGLVYEHGDATADFKIWANVPAGASAVVEVSLDGSFYAVIDSLTTSDQAFDLSRIGAAAIRFVRISDSGQGGIAIDALEAL